MLEHTVDGDLKKAEAHIQTIRKSQQILNKFGEDGEKVIEDD